MKNLGIYAWNSSLDISIVDVGVTKIFCNYTASISIRVACKVVFASKMLYLCSTYSGDEPDLIRYEIVLYRRPNTFPQGFSEWEM